MHSDLLDEIEVKRLTRRVCSDISKITGSGTTLTSSSNHRDPVQTLLMRKHSEGIITPIIEAAAIDAEKRAAGAGELLLKIVSNFMTKDMQDLLVGSRVDDEWNLILEDIKKCSIPSRKSDIKKFLDQDTTYGKITIDVLETIKAGDKVLVKKSPVAKSSITRKTGYNFDDLGIESRFYSKGLWSKNNVRIYLIDGVIENVSEIHQILDSHSKSKQPAILFCIDALPDVCETVAKNFLMGNLDMILVKVPVNERHVNTLADIGAITQMHPVSCARGDLISHGLSKQDIVVRKVTITRGQVTIEDDKNISHVHDHLRDLRDKIEDNRDLAIILEPRIESLAGSSIHVDVGLDDLKKDPHIVENLDRFFRNLPKIIKMGFINKKDLSRFSEEKLCLLFGKTDATPTETIFRSIEIYLSIRQTIQAAGAAIKSI
jgi:hypothetical protein